MTRFKTIYNVSYQQTAFNKGDKMQSVLETQNMKNVGQQQSFNPVLKQLGVGEFNWIVAERKAGKSTLELANELTKRGFTGKRGGKVHQTDVSKFCIKNGFRQLRARKSWKKKTKATLDKNLNIQIPMNMKIDLQKVNSPIAGPATDNLAEKYNKEFSDLNTSATERAVAENFIANVVMPNLHLSNVQKTRVASALLR